MGRLGRVRDRMAHAAGPAAMGITIFWRGLVKPDRVEKWGAPSSLTRSLSYPLNLEFCERAPPPPSLCGRIT
jgi:hypothetical protein